MALSNKHLLNSELWQCHLKLQYWCSFKISFVQTREVWLPFAHTFYVCEVIRAKSDEHCFEGSTQQQRTFSQISLIIFWTFSSSVVLHSVLNLLNYLHTFVSYINVFPIPSFNMIKACAIVFFGFTRNWSCSIWPFDFFPMCCCHKNYYRQLLHRYGATHSHVHWVENGKSIIKQFMLKFWN